MKGQELAALLGLGLWAMACRPTEPSFGQRAAELSRREHPTAPSQAQAPAPAKSAAANDKQQGETEQQQRVKAMLERVAKVRGLPLKRSVPLKELDRPAMLQRIRRQVQEDLPPDVLKHQGITMRTMGFIPPEYDYVAGSYRLIEGQIAGFYMPSDGMMYLAEDLGDEESDETLAHELVHALQDQHFGLGPLIKYVPGDGDRITAIHALVEGDATSAMLDISVGSAFAVSESALARLLSMSTAMSETGVDTPRMIRESLTLPYSDGFRFVQALRRRGDFPAVDAAYAAPPQTTEQLMHLEKYLAKEPGLSVVVPVGEQGYRAVFDDVMGEQGMKLALEEWAHRDIAKEAAAGWGGDRMALYEKQNETGAVSYAVVWHIRMDSDEDAAELDGVLKKKMPKGCIERAKVGPMAYRTSGREAVVVAGPYEETKPGQFKESGGCAAGQKWAGLVIKNSKKQTP